MKPKPIRELILDRLLFYPSITWVFSLLLTVFVFGLSAIEGNAVFAQSQLQITRPDTTMIKDNSVVITTVTINKNADQATKDLFYQRSGGLDTLTIYTDNAGNPLNAEQAILRLEQGKEQKALIMENPNLKLPETK